MKRFFILILFSAIVSPLISQTIKQQGSFFKNGVPLIPEPKEIIFNTKTHIAQSIKIEFAIDIDPTIKKVLELNIHLSEKKDGLKEIELVKVEAEELDFSEQQQKEGYRIIIQEKKAIIQAVTDAGLFYGAHTFLQLVQPDGTLFTGSVTDWPDLAWRAVHFDSKHHQDRFDYYQDIIPRLASYKINAIVFEIEDKLAYTSHPRISAPGAFTKQQLRQLADLARQHYIDFVPLVQGLGHARYILKHPEYKHLRELPESTWQFCPLEQESFKVLFDLYDEAINATGAETFFHIGGDESYDLALCPDCAKRAEKIGREGIYLLWLQKAADYISKKGLTPIIWDDMILQFRPEHMVQLPKDIVYMRWNYIDPKVEKTTLFEQGFRCMVAPATQCTVPLFPDYEKRLYNIAYFIPSGRDLGAIGSLCTAWDDAGLHMETFWQGFIASSEYAWSGDKPGIDEFRAKFTRLFYGPNAQNLSTVYNALAQAGEFWQNSRGAHVWERSRLNRPIEFPHLPNEQIHYDSDWSSTLDASNGAYSFMKEANRLDLLYKHAGEILQLNLKNNPKQEINLKVLNSIVTLLRYNAELLRTRYHLALDYSRASACADSADYDKSLTHLKIAHNRLQTLLDHQQQAREHLIMAWEQTRYPKDRRDLGRAMSYFVPPKHIHLAELSANYDYLFWLENTLDLNEMTNSLQKIIVKISQEQTRRKTDQWRKEFDY